MYDVLEMLRMNRLRRKRPILALPSPPSFGPPYMTSRSHALTTTRNVYTI